MSHSPKLYDLTILEEFGEADSPFMKEVVTVFVVNGRKDIELLQTAVEQGKMEDIFQVVHRMKQGKRQMSTYRGMYPILIRHHTSFVIFPIC